MKNNSKYIYLCLKERNGEYEYSHKSVHELPDNRLATAKRFANNWLMQFYGGKPEFEDGGYYFHGGEVYVEIESWQFINQEEFQIVKKYF